MQEIMKKVISVKCALLIHLPLAARTCQMKVKLKLSLKLRYYVSDVSAQMLLQTTLIERGFKKLNCS